MISKKLPFSVSIGAIAILSIIVGTITLNFSQKISEDSILETPVFEKTSEILPDWKTYRNEEYGFEISYHEKETPIEEGGPTNEPNVFYFGHGPYEHKISLIVFDISERKEYPSPFEYTKVTEITIDNEEGTEYENEWVRSAGFERGVYYESHIVREITVEVEHKNKIYRFRILKAADYSEIFEIFDQMISTFKFLQ